MWPKTVRLMAAAIGACLLAGCTVAAEGPKEIPLSIEGNRFNPPEVTVPAGAPFVLVIVNRDQAAEEFESHDLRVEKVVPAGKTIRVRVRALKKGTYTFFGDFHPNTARGRIVAE